jgi:hypothetical protein
MKPGIYPDLPFVDYLAETDWVSSSMLKAHLPEHFKPFNGSSSADFGSAFHARFTGDDTPIVAVDALTWQGKAAKEEQAAITASGGVPILVRDIETLDGMEAAVRAHSVAADLLVKQTGGWEVSVFAEVDGVPSKARFDRLLDSGVGVDVKMTKNQPGPHWLSKAVLEFGYEIQEGHYRAVAESAGIGLESFKFVFCQNVHPYHVTVVELDDAFRERAAVLRDLALSRHLHPQMVDAYPGQSQTLTLTLPKWAQIN